MSEITTYEIRRFKISSGHQYVEVPEANDLMKLLYDLTARVAELEALKDVSVSKFENKCLKEQTIDLLSCGQKRGAG